MVQLENIVHPLVAAQRNVFLQQVSSQRDDVVHDFDSTQDFTVIKKYKVSAP